MHCKVTDAQLLEQKLTKKQINMVRDFCKLSANQKKEYFVAEIKKVKESPIRGSRITGFDNSYSCTYQGSQNTGIPTYKDLGLSSSSCSWHDTGGSSSSCRLQGAVACLWGCTNIDPVLGWPKDIKKFSSKTALENEILRKGYQKSYIPGDYGRYRRTLSYGYSYEIGAQSIDSSGKGYWHVEGPEPDPRFNWYSLINGWYYPEAADWHGAC